jgi:hypothetical protein
MTGLQLSVLILLIVIALLAWAFVRVNSYPPLDPSQRAEEDEGSCGINGSVHDSRVQTFGDPGTYIHDSRTQSGPLTDIHGPIAGEP